MTASGDEYQHEQGTGQAPDAGAIYAKPYKISPQASKAMNSSTHFTSYSCPLKNISALNRNAIRTSTVWAVMPDLDKINPGP